MNLTDIQFTPTQSAELSNQDPATIEAWLRVMQTTPGIKSPAGWLLAAIRTGQPPAANTDARQRLATQKAEKLVTNLGHNIPTQAELTQTIFGPPELTADTETLEHIASQLTPSQDEALGATLRAQLAYTRTHGRQPVPGTGGPLQDHDTPALRRRIVDQWRATQPPASLDADIPT